MAVLRSAEVVDKGNVNSFCLPKYTHTLVNGGITDHGKRCFEWSSNWTVKKTSSGTGRLMVVGTDLLTVYIVQLYVKSFAKWSSQSLAIAVNLKICSGFLNLEMLTGKEVLGSGANFNWYNWGSRRHRCNLPSRKATDCEPRRIRFNWNTQIH